MVEILFSNSSSGRIQGRLSAQSNENAPSVLLLPPHAQYGCTMDNKVTSTMSKAFFDCGYTVLCINYRGVGKSTPGPSGGVSAEGELHDAATALDWIEHQYPVSKHYLIGGCGFGAWTGMQLLMRRPEIESFVSVSTPTQSYDFSFLSPCPVPGIFVHGSHDEISPLSSLNALMNKMRIHKNVKVEHRVVENASHFFDNHLDDLHKTLCQYIQANYPGVATSKKHRA